MSDSSGRRDLFKPKTVGKLLSAVTGGEFGPLAETAPLATGGTVCRVGREAMATRFEVMFDVLDMEGTRDAHAALDRVEELESRMTVYRAESEVSHLNREAYDRAVAVEPDLYDLFRECRRLWEETEGCFDVALHSLLVAWGIFKGPLREPGEEEFRVARASSGMDRVRFDDAKETLRYEAPGMGINLGAIGKGYALDRVADQLRGGRLEHFLVNGGHSSFRASGSSTWERGWLVDLCNPYDWSTPIAKIRLVNRSLSTSSLSPETLTTGGPAHILDPRTGRPAVTDLIAVSAIARHASEAEALSTALFVMGLDKAREYCEKHPEVGAVLIKPDKDSGPEIVMTALSEKFTEVLS